MIYDKIRTQAYAFGFDAVGFTQASLAEQTCTDLEAFLAEGRQGNMTWMTSKCRNNPRKLWPKAVSAIILGLSYAPAENPLTTLMYSCQGSISVHARNRDYHSVLHAKLKALGRWIQATFETEVKILVDTAPLMEKPLAQAAGIGWQGHHTNIVSRRFGSWLFLGEILTSLTLRPNTPHLTHCGTCRCCRDICPTGALTADGQIDARLCISYLTIEHKDHIPVTLRPLLGNRIYGCDDCLAVCPWNRFVKPTVTVDFQSHYIHSDLSLAELANLDASAFVKRFRDSSLRRIGRDRFVRNVLLAIGNSNSQALIAAALARLQDHSPLVRGAAVWALSRLLDSKRFAALRTLFMHNEANTVVQAEWTTL